MVLNNNLITNRKIIPQTIGNFYAELYWAAFHQMVVFGDWATLAVEWLGDGGGALFPQSGPVVTHGVPERGIPVGVLVALGLCFVPEAFEVLREFAVAFFVSPCLKFRRECEVSRKHGLDAGSASFCLGLPWRLGRRYRLW